MRKTFAMCAHDAFSWFRLSIMAVAASSALSGAAVAQSLPVARLFSIFPAGGKLQTSFDLTIGGADLEGVSKLHFSNPGVTAVQKTTPPGLGQTGPQGVPNQFTVTIGPDAPLGLCEVRAIGKYGVSNPRAFVVGKQNEIIEKEPNNLLEQATEVPVGSLVNGRSNGAEDVDYFKFAASKGQRLIIDCQSYRIDSRMDPSLVLFDADGRELARDRDTNRRDPMLDFTAPQDGEYYVEVHDFMYQGSGEYYYRLRIDGGPYLDFVFPPAGQPGSNDQYTLYGRNLPGGQPSDVLGSDGKPLESLSVQIPLPADEGSRRLELGTIVEPDESGMDGIAYRLTTPEGLSNAIPLGFASAPLIVETEPNDEPAEAQAVTPPCEYVGQFYPLHDHDWVTFEATKGEPLWIEVFSQRFGLPTDPYVVVQQVTKNDKGEEQVKDVHTVDDFMENPGGAQGNLFYYDMKTDDPAFSFSPPADGTYRILVRNSAAYSHPDPRLVYRLAIRPATPDFRVVAHPRLLPFNADANLNAPTVWSPLLRKGGTELIEVIVFRRDGFNGEVRVTVDGLPPGVTASPLVVGPGQNKGSLVLSAAEDAPESMSLISIVGKAKIGEADVVRHARTATMVWGGKLNAVMARSRLSRNLAVAVSGTETAPLVIDAGKDLVLEMSRAGKVQVPVKVVRRGDFKAAVVLAPVPVPTNVKPVNVTLDDKTAEGKLEIALPANVPEGTYSFSIVGATQVNYARNPEAVAAATARKAAVDKIVAESAAAAKTATEAKAAAEKQAVAMAEAMKKAAAAAAAADKAAQDAAAKAKTAADAKAAALKAMAEAQAQAKAAAEAKTAADKTAADADAKAKQATDVQAAVAKAVEAATKAAAPKNINVAVASQTVTLKVTPAPITLNQTPPGTVKQGSKLELPVSITRLYGYADPVQLKTTVPANAKGLTVADATIAKDATDAKLVLEIAPDAAPGTFTLSVQATSKFNGQDLSVAGDVAVTVQKADAAETAK